MHVSQVLKSLTNILISLLIVACTQSAPTVTPNQAAEMLNKQQAIMVDVRELDERNEQRIEGTLFIPLKQLENRLDELALYKDSPIILQCRSGKRSEVAAQSLIKAGFKQVFNLDGGILAWDKQGLPTEKGVLAK